RDADLRRRSKDGRAGPAYLAGQGLVAGAYAGALTRRTHPWQAQSVSDRLHLVASDPESLPSPRGAHLEMVGAVLAGDGLERIAEIASAHTGAPVAVIVPRLGLGVEAWAPYERYVASHLAGGRPERPPEIVAEVPIASGGQEL